MRTLIALILTVGFCVAASMGVAQRQRPDPEQVLEVSDGDDLDLQLTQAQGPDRKPPGQSSNGEDLVIRMMEFDTDKDGKLTKVEITDARLHRLFDRSDANKDGIVTKEELASLATKEHSDERGGGPGFGGPPGFGPPGFGPPGGGPPGGFVMEVGRPGEILTRMLQDRLKLTPQQRTELEDLQKEVDGKLDKILSHEQNRQLKQLRERGPAGFGPRRGGPPGGRGFGGPPPPGGRGFGPASGGSGLPPRPPDEI